MNRQRGQLTLQPGLFHDNGASNLNSQIVNAASQNYGKASFLNGSMAKGAEAHQNQNNNNPLLNQRKFSKGMIEDRIN